MYNENDDDFMKDIEDSLAGQIQDEIGGNTEDENSDDEPRYYDEDEYEEEPPKKRHIVLKIVIAILVVIIGSGLFLTLTPPGRRILVSFATKYMYSKMQHTEPPVTKPDVPVASGSAVAESTTGSAIEPPAETPAEATDNINMAEMSDTFRNAMHEDGVYNIALLGVEAIGANTASGHTDSIMIATINSNNKTLGLTSIMRDSYVDIPEFGEHKINAAFRDGGIKTFYETIAENFNLRLDGAVFVDFDAFENIINAVGGVDIELSEEEAHYLNTTNYISNKAYRTMSPGWNHMNGNQALGYCRVRYRATVNGTANDQGRTERHRMVMEQIFKKAKNDPTKAIGAANAVLPYLRTDIKQNNMEIYMSDALELMLGGAELRQERLPDEGAYTGQKINGQAVLVIDWDKTKAELMDFIFAVPQDTASGSAVSADTGSNGTDQY